MASPTHLQYPQNEQPSLASWSAPSSASSYLNHTTAPAGGSDNHGPPPEVLPRLDGVGSMHGSGSHLLPAGLMEQSNLESTRSTATGTNLPNENDASHYSHSSNGTPNGSSADLLTQLAQAKSEGATLQKKLRQSESQVGYLTKCCTEAGTELAKSHHEHAQTRKKLQELGVQEKKGAIMGENARNSLRNVMAENVELREEVVRLRELLARNGMGAGIAAGGMGVEGAHHGGGGGAGSAHGNGIIHGNPLYNIHGGSAVDRYQQHHQHIQQHNPSVGGITSGLSGMTFASAGASTSSSQNNSTTPPPGTVPASSTASASSSLASPHEAYQLTGSYPGQSGSGSGYPGKDLDAMYGFRAPSNHLPPMAYSGSLGMTSVGNEPSPYDMAEYNTAGLPSEAAARVLEREAGPGGWEGGRGGRGRRGSSGGRGRGAGRGGGGGGGGGYRGRRN